jgi:hypothetical protein
MSAVINRGVVVEKLWKYIVYYFVAQELRQTAGRLCERGLAGACYASIISTIEIQLSLSPHQTAMPRHEVWASDN